MSKYLSCSIIVIVQLGVLQHSQALATLLTTALEVLEAEAKDSAMNLLAACGFLVAVRVVACSTSGAAEACGWCLLFDVVALEDDCP
jgi:hypothetical protein